MPCCLNQYGDDSPIFKIKLKIARQKAVVQSPEYELRTANLATPSDSIFLMVLDIDSGVVRYWGFVDSEDAKDALCFIFR